MEVTRQGQDTMDMRGGSRDRSREVPDDVEKGRLKRPHESPSPNPPQERPSVICSAQRVGAPPASERSASAARIHHERSASASSMCLERPAGVARVSPEDNIETELSSLSALMHSQVLLSLIITAN